MGRVLKAADAQRMWQAHYEHALDRRVSEASCMWGAMRAAGVDDCTEFVLEFSFFGGIEERAVWLTRLLADSGFEARVSEAPSAFRPMCWTVEAQSAPLELTRSTHEQAVRDMAASALEGVCTLLEWTATRTEDGMCWSSSSF